MEWTRDRWTTRLERESVWLGEQVDAVNCSESATPLGEG